MATSCKSSPTFFSTQLSEKTNGDTPNPTTDPARHFPLFKNVLFNMADHPGIIDNSSPDSPDPLTETIRNMPNEFNFCVNCLSTALNDPSETDNRNWTSSYTVPQSDQVPQSEPQIFTENVRRALLRLMAVDVSVSAQTIFQSWFVDNKVTRPLAKALLDSMTAAYLLRNFQGYDFLRHCAVMAEVSALCFLAGVVETPDYTVGCILYTIKECIIKKTLDWRDVTHNAECLNKGGQDPIVHYQKLTNFMNAVLLWVNMAAGGLIEAAPKQL